MALSSVASPHGNLTVTNFVHSSDTYSTRLSTLNSSVTALAASATFTGVIEPNTSSYSIGLFSNQNATLVIKQYLLDGVTVVSTTTVYYAANDNFNTKYSMSAAGKLIQVLLTNTGTATTVGFNLNLVIHTLVVNYNAPSDIASKTGRVGVYCKFTLDNSVYAGGVTTTSWVFCETHSDIYLELNLAAPTTPIIIGTQWLNSSNSVGNIDGNGVNTAELYPLWKLGNVTNIEYKLVYPNTVGDVTRPPHAFKGITAVAYQNTVKLTQLQDIEDRTNQNSGAANYYFDNASVLSATNVATKLTLTNLTESVSLEVDHNTATNVKYGFSSNYVVTGGLKNSPDGNIDEAIQKDLAVRTLKKGSKKRRLQNTNTFTS